MRIISFAWTTPALLAGQKTVTRRDWKPQYAARFHKGDRLAAYDKNPRFGGHQVAVIELVNDPFLQSTRDALGSDYNCEGFDYLEERRILVDGVRPSVLWRLWKMSPRDMWVVRFKLVEVLGG